MRRAIGVTAAPGIAQATYDAAVAKHVVVSEWVDLTATITTACAGAAASDPDSLAAGLTVTTSTGTFDGETIPCNSFAWTTHASTNDGYSETLNYDLGTVAALIPGYDPALHGIQIVADLVAPGTLNGARPATMIALAPGGTLSALTPVAGWNVVTATVAAPLYTVSATSWGTTSSDTIPAAPRTFFRLWSDGLAARIPFYSRSTIPTGAGNAITLSPLTFTALDKLFLLLGQSTTTVGAVSGLKIRFRVRKFTIANIDLSDLDLGCQA